MTILDYECNKKCVDFSMMCVFFMSMNMLAGRRSAWIFNNEGNF